MSEKEKELNDYDIQARKYPIDVLKRNICNFCLKLLLITQTLDADFCVEYILSERYSTVEETYICDGYVLAKQTHISEKELEDAKIRYCKKYGLNTIWDKI